LNHELPVKIWAVILLTLVSYDDSTIERRNILKHILVLALLGLCGLANASLIVNGSFEDGTFTPDGNNTMALNPGSTNITGWTTSVQELAWIQDPNPFPNISASDGIRSLDLMGYHDSQPTGTISQTFATNIGWTYKVTCDVGFVSQIIVSDGTNSALFDESSNVTPGWVNHSWSFVAGANSTTLSFSGGPGTAGNYAGLDNVDVSVESAVPEPTSFLALSCGAIALIRRRRTNRA
jgi:hypothetical protein